MAQNTMTEKDMFLQRFQNECATTLRVLKAYPADQSEFRPHEKSRTARELAWIFSVEQTVADMGLKGQIDFMKALSPPPATLNEAIAGFEKTCRETVSRVTNISDTELNKTVPFPAGPDKMVDVRRQDMLWMMLMDQIHHRGQFSVYLRMVGAKVPSIYGPTADEPWR